MSLVAANRARSPRRVQRGAGLQVLQAVRERAPLPDPMRLALWRQSAEARLEVALSDLDQRQLTSDVSLNVIEEIVHSFMIWTRRSVAPFSHRGQDAAQAPGSELRHWERAAEDALAVGEAEQLERFLRIWLAVIHEATASGQASLYALTSE